MPASGTETARTEPGRGEIIVHKRRSEADIRPSRATGIAVPSDFPTQRIFPLGAIALARFRATRKHAGMQGVGSGTWAFAALLVLVTFALDPTLAIFLGGIAIVFHLARTLLALRPALRSGLGAAARRLGGSACTQWSSRFPR